MDYAAKSSGSTAAGRAGTPAPAQDDDGDLSDSPSDTDDEVIDKPEISKSAAEAGGFPKSSSAAAQANQAKEEDSEGFHSYNSSVDDSQASAVPPKS
jgi:hypothetical protein